MPDIESKDHGGTRMTIKEKLERVLDEDKGWGVFPNLFRGVKSDGDIDRYGPQIDIYDFGLDDWVFFLDKVNSLGDLLEGLRQLSPLADEALEVVEKMDVQDFRKFKKALGRERQGEKAMPGKYDALLLPERFILGAALAEKFEVSLGAALIRLMRVQEKH